MTPSVTVILPKVNDLLSSLVLQNPVTENQRENPSELVDVSPHVQPETEDSTHSPVSSSSSGYISTSVSSATLSDTNVSSTDSPSEAGMEIPQTSDKLQSQEDAGTAVELNISPEPACSGGEESEVAKDEDPVNLARESITLQDTEMIVNPPVLTSTPPTSPSEMTPSLSDCASEASANKENPIALIEPVLQPVPPLSTQPSSQELLPGFPAPNPQTKTTKPQMKTPSPPPDINPPKPVQDLQSQTPLTSASNPFKIQKVKASGLKSFKGILHEVVEEEKDAIDPLSGLSDPLEKLEILSDTEEVQEGGPVPDWLKEDEYVTVGNNKTGTVRYIGPTDFADGIWVGVELDVPAGICVLGCSASLLTSHDDIIINKAPKGSIWCAFHTLYSRPSL